MKNATSRRPILFDYLFEVFKKLLNADESVTKDMNEFIDKAIEMIWLNEGKERTVRDTKEIAEELKVFEAFTNNDFSKRENIYTN